MAGVVLNFSDTVDVPVQFSKFISFDELRENSQAGLLEFMAAPSHSQDVVLKGHVLQSDLQLPQRLLRGTLGDLDLWVHRTLSFSRQCNVAVLQISVARKLKPLAPRDHWRRGDAGKTVRSQTRALGSGPDAKRQMLVVEKEWKEFLLQKSETCPCHF